MGIDESHSTIRMISPIGSPETFPASSFPVRAATMRLSPEQVKRFYAHDEEGKAQLGDTVRIAETRPLSKLKRWRLVEIIKH